MVQQIQKNSGQSVYELRAVRKRRERGGAIFDLQIDKLTIHSGQFIAIIGPSGCGKSTLLDLLGLVAKPDSAEQFSLLTYNNGMCFPADIPYLTENERAAIRKQYLGYILQNGGLLPFLTILENIELTARLNNITQYDTHALKLISYLGIEDQMNKMPNQLSGGQRQRAAIARSLCHQPSIVLADEPTAAVDYQNALDIRDQLYELTRTAGVTVLMVTHDQTLINSVANKIISFQITRKTNTHTVAVLYEKQNNQP